MSAPVFPKSFKPIKPVSSEVKMPSSFKPINKEPKKQEEFPFEGENDLDREIERNTAMLTSRAIERVAGIPGDIASLFPGSEGKRLPTSSELREKSEKLSLGYTKPKTDAEEKGGEFIGDVASLIAGPLGVSKLGTIGRAIGIPLAGQIAREGTEKLSGSKKAGEYAKMGTMLLTDLWGLRKGIGQGGAKEFGFKSLDNAEKAIPKGAIAKVPALEAGLVNLEHSLKSGVTGPHSDEALRVIKEIKGHIVKGEMEASKFPTIRKDINKIIENSQGFKIGGPSKAIRRSSVKNLDKVKKEIIKAGEDWGKKNSPEFYKGWKEGNEALSVFYKSKQIGDVISKFTKINSLPVRIMLGMEAAHHPLIAIASTGAVKTAGAAIKGNIALAYRFMESPVLRKLYSSVLKEAAKGNAQQASILAQKLDKQAHKEGLKVD